MRIRSIKPEFWRSEDITALPVNLRLLFIGLWSYVDDNGVGIDDYRQIAADLFALEDDQAAVREWVREGLATLSRGLQITRYSVDGKHYLFVTNWDKHQKVDRPGKQRYPRPESLPTSVNGDDGPAFATVSRDSLDILAPGTGEQGNRGTGEVPASPGAQALVGEWIETCRKRPPKNVIGQMSKHIKALLEEGIDPDDIRRGIESWSTKGLHPSTLPSVVNEVMNYQARASPQMHQTDANIAAFLQPTQTHLRALPGGEP